MGSAYPLPNLAVRPDHAAVRRHAGNPARDLWTRRPAAVIVRRSRTLPMGASSARCCGTILKQLAARRRPDSVSLHHRPRGWRDWVLRTRTDPPRHHHANLVVREEMYIHITLLVVFFDLDDFRFRNMRRLFRHIPTHPDRQPRRHVAGSVTQHMLAIPALISYACPPQLPFTDVV